MKNKWEETGFEKFKGKSIKRCCQPYIRFVKYQNFERICFSSGAVREYFSNFECEGRVRLSLSYNNELNKIGVEVLDYNSNEIGSSCAKIDSGEFLRIGIKLFLKHFNIDVEFDKKYTIQQEDDNFLTIQL